MNTPARPLHEKEERLTGLIKKKEQIKGGLNAALRPFH